MFVGCTLVNKINKVFITTLWATDYVTFIQDVNIIIGIKEIVQMTNKQLSFWEQKLCIENINSCRIL